MNDTPTPRCDALEDQLRHDPEASRDFELVCFSDLARDLERQLAEATAWRKIETAPKDGRDILAWTAGIRIVRWDDIDSRDGKGWAYGDLAHSEAWWYNECSPTHWQPLPKQPTDNE